ncbi:hypothetical protein EDB89DRAFT_919851 [Lactarius sanguifluus]|nr:hypothetical protein EDB89DRAFT_919851 [Lactarius sanguifluus]
MASWATTTSSRPWLIAFQLGHPSEQLCDSAVRQRSRAPPCWTALYHPSERHAAWALQHRREIIRDADEEIFTRAQVPVSLTLYPKWQLEEPLWQAHHFNYSLMAMQRSIDCDSVKSSLQFLDALRTHVMDDLQTTTLEYGIILKDLAIIDKQFKSQSCPSLREVHANETLITPQNVDRESHNKVKQEEDVLSITPIEAQVPGRTAETDTEAYSAVTVAETVAKHTRLEGFATQAAAIHIKVRTGAKVADEFAEEMSRRREEIQRVAVFGHKAVFVPTEVMSVASQVLDRTAAGVGVDLRK